MPKSRDEPNPATSFGAEYLLYAHLLPFAGAQAGVEFIGNAVNSFDITAKMSEHRIVKVIAEHKRLAYHKLAVTFLFCEREELPVSRFVFVEQDGVTQFVFGVELVPDIVDADEDAEDIGIVVEAIPLPSVFEVADGVAGDSGVEDIKVVCRVFAEEKLGERS